MGPRSKWKFLSDHVLICKSRPTGTTAEKQEFLKEHSLSVKSHFCVIEQLWASRYHVAGQILASGVKLLHIDTDAAVLSACIGARVAGRVEGRVSGGRGG